MSELDEVKAELQRKTEALEEILSFNSMEDETDEMKTVAKKALTPVFKPEVGKLYMHMHIDNSDPFPAKWEHNDLIEHFYGVRELTHQEWIDLGAPYIELIEHQLEDKPQLTITEEKAESLRKYAVDCCAIKHEQHILMLLDGAKVESKTNKLDTLFKNTKLANEAMDLLSESYINQGVNRDEILALGKRIHEAKEKE